MLSPDLTFPVPGTPYPARLSRRVKLVSLETHFGVARSFFKGLNEAEKAQVRRAVCENDAAFLVDDMANLHVIPFAMVMIWCAPETQELWAHELSRMWRWFCSAGRKKSPSPVYFEAAAWALDRPIKSIAFARGDCPVPSTLVPPAKNEEVIPDPLVALRTHRAAGKGAEPSPRQIQVSNLDTIVNRVLQAGGEVSITLKFDGKTINHALS